MSASGGPQTLIAPMVSVRRGAQAIDFYNAAFGAEEMFRIQDDKGELVVRLEKTA